MTSRIIPEQVIEDVKSSSELVSVVEQYVRLDKRSGANFFGLCPFHQEDTPSFSVSPSKQIFYCFGCNKGGNVINFIMEIEKCSYPEAIRMLAERAGIKIPEPDDAAWQKRNERNRQLYEIYLEAARWFYKNITGPQGKIAVEYLKKRGISAGLARKFGLGYAPGEWDGLLQHLTAKQYPQELLLQSGLFKRGRNGGLYDVFRQRLIFPIFDVMGKVIAFGGRVLDDSMPKYINSPETPVYTKGRHLYALNLAKQSREKQIIIVEGYMDAISLYQAGIDCVVASLGTALTENQARLLARYTENVTIAYDADVAGQNAALRSLDILQKNNIKVNVLQVPEGKDPDDYIHMHGPERFNALVEKALPLIDFKLLAEKRKATSDGRLDLLAYQDAACDLLAHEENAIVRELYAGKLAEELNASPDTVLREIERRHQQPAENKEKDQLRQTIIRETESAEKTSSAEATKEEIYLLTILADQPDIYEQLDPQPQADDFTPGLMAGIAAEVFTRLKSGRLDPSSLIELGEATRVQGRLLSELLARASMKLEERFGSRGLNIAAGELLHKMKTRRLLQKKDDVNRKLKLASAENRDELKKELLRLTKYLNEIKRIK